MVWEGDVFVACLHWWAVRELLDVVTAGVEEVKGGKKKKKKQSTLLVSAMGKTFLCFFLLPNDHQIPMFPSSVLAVFSCTLANIKYFKWEDKRE